MSEPVTNVEIEDVLSSIRRLVTESGSKPDENAFVLENAERSSDKAVEQVAKAVSDQNKGQVDPVSETALEQEDRALDKLVLTPALRVAEPDDVSDSAEEVEPEVSSEAEEVGNTDEESQTDEAQFAEVQEEDLTDEHSEEAAAEDSFKGRIERLETAVASQPQDWEEDEPEDQTAVQSFETLQWEDHTDEATLDEAATFIAPQPESVEEDEEQVEEAQERAVDAAATEEAREFDFLGDDTLIDEEMLREMVADIVRQELQGALGERITRNVRKLVRREIQRALMAQELD